MSSAATIAQKLLRQQRRKNSLCVRCGVLADNGTRCKRCTEIDNGYAKARAARAKAAGCCPNGRDHEKPKPGNFYCDICITLANTRVTKDYRQRRKQGLCLDCDTVASGSVRCEACADKENKRATAHRQHCRENGICSSCLTRPAPADHRLCPRCHARGRKHHQGLKLEVCNAYGGPVCVGCGETEVAILQIDHIDGGGHKHAVRIGGRGKMYGWLKKNNFPPGFRVLCPSCNIRAARGLPFPNTTSLLAAIAKIPLTY